MLKKKISV